MLVEEAHWIGARFAALPDERIFPLVNIGSSTEHFRSTVQPHINEQIFSPLHRRHGAVYHVDIKSAPGVDIVGDLHDATFLETLRNRTAPRSILVSNLLEHVADPFRVADGLLRLVPPDGVIIVSGPHAYPYHPDPIDTRFRPSVEQAHALFPDTRLLEGAVIVSDSWRPWSALAGRRAPVLQYFARLALPFYHPTSWLRQTGTLPYAFRRVSAYALVLTRGEAVADASRGLRG